MKQNFVSVSCKVLTEKGECYEYFLIPGQRPTRPDSVDESAQTGPPNSGLPGEYNGCYLIKKASEKTHDLSNKG